MAQAFSIEMIGHLDDADGLQGPLDGARGAEDRAGVDRVDRADVDVGVRQRLEHRLADERRTGDLGLLAEQ